MLKTKIKGAAFEAAAVDLLTEKIKGSSWKRVPLSGAMGTILNEPSLLGDVTGFVEPLGASFRVECKVGYGGKTQFTLKKEWLDKIKVEGALSYSLPILLGKFSGARDGTRVFVVMDIDTFSEIINRVSNE